MQPRKELSQVQQEYLVDVIMTWIQKEMECHLNKKARRSSHKNHIKGPKKRTEEDDVRFAQSFEKMLMMVQEKFQKNTKTMETGRKENK